MSINEVAPSAGGVRTWAGHSRPGRSEAGDSNDLSKHLQALADTLKSLHCNNHTSKNDVRSLAHMLRDAQHIAAAVLNGDAETLRAHCAARLAHDGSFLLPLYSWGQEKMALAGHFMLLLVTRAEQGHDLRLFNLGTGAQYAVPLAQRPYVLLQAGLRCLQRRIEDKTGLRVTHLKIPNALTVHASAGFEVYQLVALLGPCSVPCALPGSLPTLEQATADLYDTVKAFGRADYSATQRLQAPQDVGNCLYKSAMAALSVLPETDFHRARAALLSRSPLAVKARKAQLRQHCAQKRLSLAADALPATPRWAAGFVASLLGCCDNETRHSISSTLLCEAGASVAKTSLRVAQFCAGVSAELQSVFAENRSNMTIKQLLERRHGIESVDQLLPVSVQYAAGTVYHAAAMGLVGPLFLPWYNYLPFPLRLWHWPVTGSACALLGAAAGIFGVAALRHLPREINPRTLKPEGFLTRTATELLSAIFHLAGYDRTYGSEARTGSAQKTPQQGYA